MDNEKELLELKAKVDGLPGQSVNHVTLDRRSALLVGVTRHRGRPQRTAALTAASHYGKTATGQEQSPCPKNKLLYGHVIPAKAGMITLN